MWERFLWVVPALGFATLGVGEPGERVVESDTLRVYWLDEVVITATRTERAIKDLSATVSVVTRDEIESSNANSCTDILNTLPGVFVERTGAFGRADPNIRGIGGGGRQVMVLVDGRPVKMGLFGCTVTHSLPLDNVERIEVVRGPMSVLYGSDALGGVINIITRRVEEGFEADLVTAYGTHNTQQYRVMHGGCLAKFNYYLTGDKRSSDGHLDNSRYDGKHLTARAGYEVAPGLEATLTGKWFSGYKEEPRRATDPDTLISETWNDYERGALAMTLTGSWEKWSGDFKLYRNFGEHKFSDDWHSEDFTNGALLHGSARPISGNELLVGAEFRQQGGEKLATKAQPDSGSWNKTEYAIFFHDEQILLGKLIISLGGRYNEDEVSGRALSPQIGLVFHPWDGTILRGGIKNGFRSPQLNELYIFPPSNPDLKPEIIWNYEVGINQRVAAGVGIDLVGYIMRGVNLIQLEKDPDPPPGFKFQNGGEFTFKGVETGLSVDPGKRWSGRLYYTYLDPAEHTKGRPGNKVDLAIWYTRSRFAFSLNGQYVSDYFAADNSKEPIEEYFVANAKLSYELPFGIRPFLAVDNLLDEEYEIYADLPGGAAGLYSMPRRAVTVGLSLKF